jgi:tetratricopeptide (TPR) repeat protein
MDRLASTTGLLELVRCGMNALICAAAFWCLPAQPAQTSPAPAPARPAATNAAERAPSGEVPNPALRQTAYLITNSLVHVTAHDPEPELSSTDPYEMLLNVGRQQRAQKNFTLAKRNFVALLQGPGPDQLKRAALLELATMAQEQNELAKAQQLYAQYLRRWPDDPSVPEVYLRQGLLFRQMGAPVMALAKFYAVMSSALTLKTGNVDYYQKLVLHAQAEIAETHYLQGNYKEAAQFYRRLLKLEAPSLNRAAVQLKLIRSLAALSHHAEVIAEAQDYLQRYPRAEAQAEVRFLLAQALKQSGRKAEALKQVLLLLETQLASADQAHSEWSYWQRRTGNEIGNQLYEEGDYLNALTVYGALAALDSSPAWQWPVWYQMGLIYERLGQPQKAAELYSQILARRNELKTATSPSLGTVLDMARWRKELLEWQNRASPTLSTNWPSTAQLGSP